MKNKIKNLEQKIYDDNDTPGLCVKGGTPTNYRYNDVDPTMPLCVYTSKCRHKTFDNFDNVYCGFLIDKGYNPKRYIK